MEEADRELRLLGNVVTRDQASDDLYWHTVRSGYYMHVIKYLRPHEAGPYHWNVGLLGNTGSFMKGGISGSLDGCVGLAHQAIATHLQELDEFKVYITNYVYVDANTPKSRFDRPPVI